MGGCFMAFRLYSSAPPADDPFKSQRAARFDSVPVPDELHGPLTRYTRRVPPLFLPAACCSTPRLSISAGFFQEIDVPFCPPLKFGKRQTACPPTLTFAFLKQPAFGCLLYIRPPCCSPFMFFFQ